MVKASLPGADAVLHIAAEVTPAVAVLVAAVVAQSEAAGKATVSGVVECQAVNDARSAPAGLGVKFAPVPHFMAKVQDELELADQSRGVYERP